MFSKISLKFREFHWKAPVTFVKKRLQHRCFPVNSAKLLRTLLLQNTSAGSFCQCFPLLCSMSFLKSSENYTQSAITCSKLTTETLEQGVKYVHCENVHCEICVKYVHMFIKICSNMLYAIGVVLVPLLLTFNLFHTLL